MSSLASWAAAQGIGSYKTRHKFGINSAVGTSFVPITMGSVYQMPLVGDEQRLRVKAGNANDTAAGSGARSIVLIGIDANLNEILEVVVTNGTSAGVLSTKSFYRLYTVEVFESGTYGSFSPLAGSNAANVVIEDASANEWATIAFDGVGRGRSQVGCYTVPDTLIDGTVIKEAYLSAYIMSVEANKPADVLMMGRLDSTTTVAPHGPMSILREHDAVAGTTPVDIMIPIGPAIPGTDFGFLTKLASGTGIVSIDFEVILVKA